MTTQLTDLDGAMETVEDSDRDDGAVLSRHGQFVAGERRPAEQACRTRGSALAHDPLVFASA